MVATVISTARLPLLSADVSHDGSVVVAFESSHFTPPGPSFRRVHPSPLGLRTPALGPLRFSRPPSPIISPRRIHARQSTLCCWMHSSRCAPCRPLPLQRLSIHS